MLILPLIIFGIITGVVAGFFGVGGGMVLIPMLLFFGFSMKSAIGISIVQMVFTSIFGSIFNFSKHKHLLKDSIILGFGGFLGGLNSGFIVSYLSNPQLQYLFLFIVIFAIYRVSVASTSLNNNKNTNNNKFLLIFN